MTTLKLIPSSKRKKIEKGENIIIESSVLFNSITEQNALKALLIAKYGLKELIKANETIKQVVNLKLRPEFINGVNVEENKKLLQAFLDDYNNIVLMCNTSGYLCLKISCGMFNSAYDTEGNIVQKKGYKISLVKKELNVYKETSICEVVEKMDVPISNEKIALILNNINNINVIEV